MEAAVVGAVVGTTYGVVLDGLLEIPIEEIKLVYGFKTELEKLKNSLQMVQAFFSDAEEIQLQKRSVKLWLERLEDVAFEADAVLDELSYELLRQKAESQNQVLNKVTCCFSLCSSNYNSCFRRKMAHKIDDVNKSLERINKEARGFGLQTAVANATLSSNVGLVIPMELQTPSTFVEPNFVGREQDVSKIVEMLVNAPLENKVSVIPVVGMGGIGKTTVVREVFHHRKIHSHFKQKVWVCVSLHFSAVTIFKMILERTSGENVQLLLSIETVLEKLQQHFSGKKYLLVLDDIWNDDSDKWEEFINPLRSISSVEGNCIIITTRKANVASLVNTLATHRLGSLSADDCWSIIKSKALPETGMQVEFEKLGKSIAVRCHGLPLAAKVVGGLLNGKPREEWCSLLENQLSYFGQDENTVLKILKLSYDRLPSSSLQKCFAYCSIFQQDSLIAREKLIGLWMAEGFLQRNDMETRGNVFFNILVNNSLVEEVNRDAYGNILSCKMHDLVHDLACSVSGSRSLALMDSESTDVNQVRYLSLKSDVNEVLRISVLQGKYLRTVFLKGEVAFNTFSRFKRLHVLTLANEDIQELPNAIGELKYLRLLDISETNVKFLPDSVSKLYNLQTLRDVPDKGSTKRLEKLPEKITSLTSLRHLHIPCMQLPPGMGKLVCLQTLPYYKVGHEKGCEIGELGKLKNLKGELEIQNLERVKDTEEAKSARLSGKTGIFRLCLRWSGSREGENKDRDVLEGLQPQPNLKSLDINGYKGGNFPFWAMNMSIRNEAEGYWEALNNLVDVKIENCSQCEEVPMLGHLPHLKILKLSYLSKVRSLGLVFHGIQRDHTSSMKSNENRNGTFIPFPSLESLSLNDMPNLTEWVEVERVIGAFPRLDYMFIMSCPLLQTTPCHFSCLKRLDAIEVHANFSLTSMHSETSSIQELHIDSVPGLTSLPDDFLVKNQSMSKFSVHNCPDMTRLVPYFVGDGAFLRSLTIVNCDSLTEIPEGLERLQFLESIEINDCPELKSIRYARGHPQGLKSLRHLQIGKCQKLSNFPCELLESCTSLETLSLYELDDLSNFANAGPFLSRMQHLREFQLHKIPKLVNLPMEICSLRSVIVLSIGEFSKSMDQASFNEFLGRILHESLRELILYGQEDWESLPDQIQHLKDLVHLRLCHFEVEVLPEWIGNLSSLKELRIVNFQSLSSLPSMEAMQCLSKLKELSINDCPLIEEKCSQQNTAGGDDTELLKISHIEFVGFNEYRVSCGSYRE